MTWLGEKFRALGRGIKTLLTGFPEAIPRPVDPMVQSQGAPPDWSLEQGWDRRYMVDRAQQLHRANLLAGSIIDRSTDHVVGLGYRLQALTGDPGFNLESRLRWEDWAGNKHLCDVRERDTYWQLMRLAYKQEGRDGDCLFVMRDDKRLRLVGSIEIASPVGGYYRTTEADGVERDKNGKHLAYWVFDPDEVPYSNIRAAIHRLVRIPAEHCVFMANCPLGSQQTRGSTKFQGTFQLFEQVDGMLISVAVKARTAAKFAMIVTKKSPLPTTNFGSNGNQQVKTPVGDGTVTRLELDEDMKPVQAADPSTNLIDAAKFMVRISGARWALSLATITFDHSDHNFSNARASAIETNKCTENEQLWVAQATADVRNMLTLAWIREGTLGRKLRRKLDQGGDENLRRALRHKWRPPARPLIDPLTERQADLLGYDMGAVTLADIAAREGKTVRELARQQKRERDLWKKEGLPDVRSNMSREVMERIMTGPDQPAPKKK